MNAKLTPNCTSICMILLARSCASRGERRGVRDDERGDHAEPDSGPLPRGDRHQRVSEQYWKVALDCLF